MRGKELFVVLLLLHLITLAVVCHVCSCIFVSVPQLSDYVCSCTFDLRAGAADVRECLHVIELFLHVRSSRECLHLLL